MNDSWYPEPSKAEQFSDAIRGVVERTGLREDEIVNVANTVCEVCTNVVQPVCEVCEKCAEDPQSAIGHICAMITTIFVLRVFFK